MNVDESFQNEVVLQPETDLEEAVIDELQRVVAAVANESIDELVAWRDLAGNLENLEEIEPGRTGERVLVVSWGPS